MTHDIIHTPDIIFSSSDNTDKALLWKEDKSSNTIFVAVDSQKEKNIWMPLQFLDYCLLFTIALITLSITQLFLHTN